MSLHRKRIGCGPEIDRESLEQQKFLQTYPKIAQCCEIIGHDNGAFHRDQDMTVWWRNTISSITKFSADLVAIEEQLANLTEENLELICIGENSESEEFLKALVLGELINDLLFEVFEVC